MSSDRDKTSYWNELASQIGAEVPAEPTQSETDATNTESPPATPSPKMPAERQAAKREPKPRADWKDLAGELGVEVDWTEYSSTPVSHGMPVETEDKEKSDDRPAESPAPTSDYAAPPPADEAGQVSQSEPEPSKRSAPSNIPSFTFSDVPTVDEMNEVLEQANVRNIRTPTQESAFDLSVFDEDDDTAPVDDDTAPEDDAAAHADSERGPESKDESQGEQRPRRRRRRGRRSRRPTEAGDAPENKTQSDSESEREPAATVPDGGVGQDSGANRGARPEDKDHSRPRRRRRRRGQKSEIAEDANSAADTAGSGKAEIEKLGFIADDYDLFDATETAPADTPTDSDPAGDSDDEAHDDPRVAHRKIPSWDEAIGIVVEANLASRRKGDKSGSRGRGRGRGSRGDQRK